MQTLEQFLEEKKAQLSDFEFHWRRLNEVDPETYPLFMADGNEGMWDEQLQNFDLLPEA
mgnify:CR=1 FL=1